MRSASSPEMRRARQDLDALRSFVRRTGLTGWVRQRSAGPAYQRALCSVVAVEDRYGVEVAGPLVDRLRALYFEARERHLLDVDSIVAAETSVLGTATT